MKSLRSLLLLAVLLNLAACVGTRVRNLSTGAGAGPVAALLIVHRPTTFAAAGSTGNIAGSLGGRNLAELVPHLQARLPLLLGQHGIRARMVSERELAGVQRAPDERVMWIAASSASYSTRTGQALTLQAEIVEPASNTVAWRGEIVMTTLGFGRFDDSVADSIGQQLVLQLQQARMLPGQGAPMQAAAPAAGAPARPTLAPVPRPEIPVAAAAPAAAATAPAVSAPALRASGYAQIDDIDAIPYLSDRGRQVYRDWLNLPTPRAFAISPDGHFSSTSGLRPRDASLPTDPTERALLVCGRAATVPCKLYAVNGSVVWVR